MTTVAIPIETKAREFHGKLWLGLNLIANNHRVLLGPTNEIKNTLHISNPDVYITKDPADTKIRFFKKLKDSGVDLCALDTEGAIFPSLDDFARNKHKCIEYFDYYFMWGEAQSEIIRNRTNNPEKIITSGDPRFDLLNSDLRHIYDMEAKNLRTKYGEYVLFNMNFSSANHFDPVRRKNKQKELYSRYDQDKYNYTSILLSKFIESIHHLKPHKSHFNIVIRPHPSERESTYKHLFKNYDSVFVEYSGDVRSWIAGSSVVVHNSCTTGIESAMMEKPVIAFRPIKSEKYDKELPNLVSKEVNTQKELRKNVERYINKDNKYKINKNQKNELKQYFHNIDISAAKIISDQIAMLNSSDEKSYNQFKPSYKEKIEWNVKKSLLSNFAVTTYDFANELFGNPKPRMRREYQKQKFPGLTKKEVEISISRLSSVADIEPVRVSELEGTENSFKLTSSR